MITNSDFESLIWKSESSSIDFKRNQYNIINDFDKTNTAKFIKDIISFCNTIRTESAFIINEYRVLYLKFIFVTYASHHIGYRFCF